MDTSQVKRCNHESIYIYLYSHTYTVFCSKSNHTDKTASTLKMTLFPRNILSNRSKSLEKKSMSIYFNTISHNQDSINQEDTHHTGRKREIVKKAITKTRKDPKLNLDRKDHRRIDAGPAKRPNDENDKRS